MQPKLAVVLSGLGGLVAGVMISRADFGAYRVLGRNARLFSSSERKLIVTLASQGQGHLFRAWPRPGLADAAKRKLVSRAARYVAAAGAALEDERLAVLQPPVCPTREKLLSLHGDERTDPYYWLRDDSREDKDVVAYLDDENVYTRAVMADTELLQQDLYKEMRGRIQEADVTAPVRHSGHMYYSRTEEGAQYKVHCRRKLPADAKPPTEADSLEGCGEEEVLLDENEEAKKWSFYVVGGYEVSPNQKLLAWAEDTKGGEQYTLRVTDLETGKELLSKPIHNTSGSLAWANDNATLFYVTKDKLDRPFKVWRHKLGSDPKDDVCVFHEEDDAYYVGLGRSRSDEVLVIHAGSAITSDMRYLDAATPEGEWKVLLPRQDDVEYSASHRGDHFFINIRDKDRPNSEILVAPMSDPTAATVLVPHRDDVKIEGMVVSKDYLAVFQRIEGLQACTVYPLPADGSMPASLDESKGQRLAFEEPAYELGPGGQGDFDSPVLRLVYSSLTTPTSIMDHNMATAGRATKKVTPVLGGFSKDDYETRRMWALAPDGVKVPVSVVWRKGLAKLDGTDPLLLDGYGSYEICNDPYFSSNRLSLVDRGWVFAIAHIRGGGEMGRRWYEDGKFLKKKNTFTDFIATAEHLVAEQYTSPAKMSISGRSAGGLLMGAVTNMRPDLFHAVIMGVPFVDCLTTMLDETIPLTTIEFDEWGNPKEKEFYDYLKSYSPVDNVAAQAYPNILVTAGLHDPRVGYWEPAKLVAKLRATKTDNSLLLFKCEMGAGHFSQSGRFDRLKEVAIEYAFLLKTQGMASSKPVAGSAAHGGCQAA